MGEVFAEIGEVVLEGAVEGAAESGELLGETGLELGEGFGDAAESDVRRALSHAQQQSSGSNGSYRKQIGRFRARVVVTKNFGAFGQQIDTAAIRALERVGREVRDKAATNETRVRTGRLHSSLKVSPVYRTPRGFAIDVYSDDYVAIFQEKGTRAKRGRAKTKRTRDRRRAAGISHGGVKPLRFMRRATSGAAGRVVAEIRAAMR